MKKLLIITIVLCVLVLTVACSTGNNGGSDDLLGYVDYRIKNGDIEIVVDEILESYFQTTANYDYTVRLNLINRGKKVYNFTVEDIKIIRSSNKAELLVDSLYFSEISLSNDVWEQYNVSISLPTAIEDDKYTLVIKEQNATYKICLYYAPENYGGEKQTFEMYSDASLQKAGIQLSNVSVKYQSYYNTETEKAYEVSIKVKNTSESQKELKVRYAEVGNVSGTYSERLANEATFMVFKKGEETTLTYRILLPTLVDGDGYFLKIFSENSNYKLYLFETPDELREDVKITYKVNGVSVKEETIKKGRTLSSVFVYDTNDHQQHSGDWYLNDTKVTMSTIFTEDAVLTSSLFDNYSFLALTNDPDCSLNRINYVPVDKRLVLPASYLNRRILIGPYIIYNLAVKEIYVPKAIDTIYYGNFSNCSGLEKIYYSGTQAEWTALLAKQSLSIPSGVQVIFNTPFRG